jgi:hypothetical protein
MVSGRFDEGLRRVGQRRSAPIQRFAQQCSAGRRADCRGDEHQSDAARPAERATIAPLASGSLTWPG